ncbi:hypothetical protein HanXRQr2_Chr16g0769801 [Helianthus annuus]|uniref:Uncharacterized protein n=1 Tax=Helianthus annuus TaxID=4232 RepID=A0A9K3DWZ0_HELAN|nr:hypothetical protein HanXRQr2_Chr16g0769801 [Helianthus annuus]KAJ0439623.1 hypothetical protein HanHA300_Chr16g0627391 [Helianthus annuus]KAJ0444778.1 hypothetical protein HanIR_Chr16g0835541 [Helianthus annuus]KAJ0462007.1 hypothetical protein HanHA89_Chr16g0678641 [Helianthus annuus]KAJ0642402.1 hypothetical protein HanLR1_Chr16g0637861 [Helianthus annuus]
MIKVGETLLKLSVDDSSLAHDGAKSSLGSDTSDPDDKAGVKKSQKGEALCTPAVRSLAKDFKPFGS